MITFSELEKIIKDQEKKIPKPVYEIYASQAWWERYEEVVGEYIKTFIKDDQNPDSISNSVR